MAEFCSGDFAVWDAHAALKWCTEVILCIELKQSHYLQYVQSSLEIFICHLAAAVPLLEIDNILPICRYIIEIWPAMMACTSKNRVLLAVFRVKLSIFHFGQTEHRSSRGDDPLFAPHRALVRFIWCRATQRTRETELNWLSNRDFPIHALRLLGWFPASRSRFRVSHQATYCARRSLTSYGPVVLSLLRACSPPPHAAWDHASVAAGPSTFRRRVSQWVSLRAAGCSY